MQFLLDPQVWIDLLILSVLEIVLGIDNIVFIILASNRLPLQQQVLARRMGLLLAMITRLLLLGVIFWLAQLTATLFSIGPLNFSIRDIVEIGGGLFLFIKAYQELHEHFTKHHQQKNVKQPSAKLWLVLLQIMLLDIIFSIDSVITAVAIAQYYTVMAAAIVIAIIVMVVASEPVNYFINKYIRIKLLAIMLLLLVGFMLICHGFGWEYSEWYLYGAILILAVIILPPWKKWFKLR